MNRIALATALTVALAAPALASDQLARSLGVEPGAYTTAELVALRSAQEGNEFAVANAIRAKAVTGGGFSVSSKNDTTSRSPQLEASVGAEGLSTAEVIALRSAEEDGNWAVANFIRDNGGNGAGFSASSKSGVSPAQAQLAASLGVDAADYTLAELAHLKSVQSTDNGRD